jgi:hypothetical protein
MGREGVGSRGGWSGVKVTDRYGDSVEVPDGPASGHRLAGEPEGLVLADGSTSLGREGQGCTC